MAKLGFKDIIMKYLKKDEAFKLKYVDPLNKKNFHISYRSKGEAEAKMAQLKRDGVKDIQITQEDAPANATGTAVAGTGDDSSTVVVKKKKELQKKLMTRMGITESIDRAIPDLEYPKDEIRERVNQLKQFALGEAPDPITYGPDKVAKAMKIAVKSSGMYSKAVREIEKIGKDLSKVSTIARALKTANEEKQMNEAKETEMYYLEFDVDSSKEFIKGKAGPDRALAGIEVEEQVKAASMEEAFRHFKQVIIKYTNRMKGKLKLNVKFMGTFPRVSAENKRGERLTQQLSKDIERKTMRNESYVHPGKATFERIYKEVSDKLKLKVLDRKIKKAKDKFHKGLRRP